MDFKLILFYVLSTILVGASLGVVTARNPVNAAMFLVLSFFTAAMVWMLAQAEFLAIVLILVYVGAVMVLFLFVVMMLDINFLRLQEGFMQFLPVGLLVGLILLLAALALRRLPPLPLRPLQGASDADGLILGMTPGSRNTPHGVCGAPAAGAKLL